MIAAGIRQVYLLEGSEVLFNRETPDNRHRSSIRLKVLDTGPSPVFLL